MAAACFPAAACSLPLPQHYLCQRLCKAPADHAVSCWTPPSAGYRSWPSQTLLDGHYHCISEERAAACCVCRRWRRRRWRSCRARSRAPRLCATLSTAMKQSWKVRPLLSVCSSCCTAPGLRTTCLGTAQQTHAGHDTHSDSGAGLASAGMPLLLAVSDQVVVSCMLMADAEPYMASLVKAFRRTVEEGRFPVVIVDAPHLLADDLKAYWASGQVRVASSSCGAVLHCGDATAHLCRGHPAGVGAWAAPGRQLLRWLSNTCCMPETQHVSRGRHAPASCPLLFSQAWSWSNAGAAQQASHIWK